jgi:hypothetical protein
MKNATRCQYQYSSDCFSYAGKKTGYGWDFHCKVDGTTVNTREFPRTLSILKEMIPGVLQTQCFNEHNDPFILEVTKTEIGHLFEHVLLYLLLQEQMKKGLDKIVYEGKTSWNWRKNPRGDFWVRIWGPKIAASKFQKLIDQATSIIEIVMSSNKTNTVLMTSVNTNSLAVISN